MLKTALLHPELLSALASAGHGAKILIADSNYPVSTGAPRGCRRVYLNVRAGLVRATDMLEVLLQSVPVESAAVMQRPDREPVAIQQRYRELLGLTVPITEHERFAFYEDARSPWTALVIATGESRRFANILLTVGVIKGDDD